MGGQTLLEETWQRSMLAVPREQGMVVVTQRHEVFYGPLLRATGIPHIVAQPENRGTGPASSIRCFAWPRWHLTHQS